MKLTGRRPALISSEAISVENGVNDFVQISGRILDTVSEVSFETLSNLTEAANSAGVSSLKLRCQIDPDVQPKLQSAIDRAMKQFGSNSNETRGFVTEAGEGYAICQQM